MWFLSAIFAVLCLVSSVAQTDKEKALNIYNWADHIGPDTRSDIQK